MFYRYVPSTLSHHCNMEKFCHVLYLMHNELLIIFEDMYYNLGSLESIHFVVPLSSHQIYIGN